MGDTGFYGKGKTVDTSSKFTVVTQFLTGSDGNLSEIKRFYVQGGKVIPNSESKIAGVTGNSITTDFCSAQKTAFGDTNVFADKGGLAKMGDALKAGMVLVMSVWDDHAVNMLWLDSTFPTDSTALGSARGSCPTTSGVPADVEAQVPNSNVIYSNIKVGPIGSTFSGAPGGTTPGGGGSGSSTSVRTSTTSVRSSTTTMRTSTTTSRAGTTTTAAPGNGGGSTTGADHWQQCGGIGFTGPTTCKSPWKCTVSNPYYSQCL
jgi:cellulose 1,4-beta-cellobiosidase